MRILVTGVSGQVGGALISRLRSHDLMAANREMLDLTKPDQIAQTLDKLEPELIINPAAYTAVDKAEDEAELAHLINATSPGLIAKWSEARGVPLIHFSTDYVFDGSGERPWREDDPTNPLSIYGASKLAGEKAVRDSGGSFLIVRTSWVYAATGSNFLRAIARRAVEQAELRVVADQFGAPTSAALIAEVITGLIDEGPDASRCASVDGVVHVSSCSETSWHGFATAIVAGLKSRGVRLAAEKVHPIRSEEYPTRAKRPRNSRLDLSRLREVFAIVPPSWADALSPELDHLAKLMR